MYYIVLFTRPVQSPNHFNYISFFYPNKPFSLNLTFWFHIISNILFQTSMNVNNNNYKNNDDDVVIMEQPVVIDLLGGPGMGTCSICLAQTVLWADPPSQGEVAVEPNRGCGHVFHHKCLQQWLETFHLYCPTCRAPCSACAVIVE
jgi:hypothetical protein